MLIYISNGIFNPGRCIVNHFLKEHFLLAFFTDAGILIIYLAKLRVQARYCAVIFFGTGGDLVSTGWRTFELRVEVGRLASLKADQGLTAENTDYRMAA